MMYNWSDKFISTYLKIVGYVILIASGLAFLNYLYEFFQ